MKVEPSLVLRDDQGPVSLITLNRPDRRNALSRSLVSQLGDHLAAVASDPAIRVVVLTGSGPVFCAGMDLKEACESGGQTDAERLAVADLQALADLIQQVHTMPQATIAALQGDALAGGAGLAMACDLVVASSSAHIGFPEVRRGLVASVVLHDLVRLVGERRARALLLGGSPIDAATACSWGLINEVVGPGESAARDRAIALSRELCGGAPQAIATLKRLIDEATRRPRDLRGAAAISAAVRVSEEANEGMRAFLERRAPSWALPQT
ncbi:MAG: enoyl-CoA hydratase-related protein [Isosphaeraceae bacterium]